MVKKTKDKIELNDENISDIKIKMGRVSQSLSYAIDTFKTALENGGLKLDPTYQRNYIQNDREASKFIESVFLGCTIPQVQLHKNAKSVLEVVDGQQRLTSLLNFRNNKLALTGLTELPELNGYTFDELPKELQMEYGNFNVDAKITHCTDPDFVFMVFERVNSGSKALNKQEIRNCVKRGKLNDLITKLAEEDFVNEVIKVKENNMRFQLQEDILRILTVQEFYPIFKRTKLQDSMNLYMDNHSDDFVDDEFLKKVEKEFLDTLKLVKTILGIKAFYKSGAYSISVAETVMLNFQRFNKHDIFNNANDIRESIFNLVNFDERFDETTKLKKNSNAHIIARIELVYDLMKSIIEKGIQVDSKRLFTKEHKQAIWDMGVKNGGAVTCSVCGQPILDIDDAEVDHIVPYSKGGKTELDNGQLLHQHCNRVKNNQYEKEPQKMEG